MTPIGQLGMNAASEAIGGIMGITLGGINDERQRRQQEKLQEIQMKGQKEMMDYSQMKQMQMWHATNYGEQIKELNKAGLNAGLIYGMSGGGGTTTGSPNGNTTGGTAPSGGGEAQAFAGMGLQNAMSLQLMQQQKELLEAQTEKTKAEAIKTAGVDTKETEQNIENLFQGLQNLRQTYEVTRLDITMKNIQNFEQQASQKDRLDYIGDQTKIAEQQIKALGYENKISKETVTDKIKQIRAEAIGAALRNEMTKQQISLTKEQQNAIAQGIMRDWDSLANEKEKTNIQRQLMQYSTDITTQTAEKLAGSIQSLIHVIIK